MGRNPSLTPFFLTLKEITIERRLSQMATCPVCGENVRRPIKEWDLSPKVHVKLYECCGKKFREYMKR